MLLLSLQLEVFVLVLVEVSIKGPCVFVELALVVMSLLLAIVYDLSVVPSRTERIEELLSQSLMLVLHCDVSEGERQQSTGLLNDLGTGPTVSGRE